jgi:hypothetical protein
MLQLCVWNEYVFQSQPGEWHTVTGLCCSWHKCGYKTPECCKQEKECGTTPCLDQHIVRIQGHHAVN